MKTFAHFLPVLVLYLCLASCGPKERPVEPSDGKSPVSLESPQMVVEDGHIYIFYLRNGYPVRSEILEDLSLTEPVYVDEKKWLNFLECELTMLPEVDEETQEAVNKMQDPSELVPTPDGVRLFFTAFNPETGKREMYWIRNGGVLPVQISSDNWWADFSVPFGFMEMKDEAFLDGTKAYLALCLCTDHWNAGEICGIYMNGSTQYLIFSHENTLLRDSLSNTVPVGRTDMTTSDGTVIPYLNYRARGFRRGDGPIHIQYLDGEFPSIMAWNEKALENAQAGENVFVVSEHSFRSAKDKEEFEQYIHTNFEQ